MSKKIAHIALIVLDYDEAIEFYTQKLGFILLEDTILNETKRWVLIAPNSDTSSCTLLLAKATNKIQENFIGNQTGGRVFLFLDTDDFYRDYYDFMAKGIKFIREPNQEEYGIVAVFEDLYGNLWDLIERK